MQGECDAFTLERLTLMAEEFERSALAAEQAEAVDVERRDIGQGRPDPDAPRGL